MCLHAEIMLVQVPYLSMCVYICSAHLLGAQDSDAEWQVRSMLTIKARHL